MGLWYSKKVWRETLLCLFWKEKNLKVFENEEHSIQLLKMFFSKNLFHQVKQYIEIDSLSLFGFFKWLGSS